MSRAPNNNKQPCSCQTSLRNLLFHLVQRISLHFKLTDLYLFCTMKVFPKFLLPFQSQASFQSEQFGSYDFAALSLSLVACSLTSQRLRMLMQKRPLFPLATKNWGKQRVCYRFVTDGNNLDKDIRNTPDIVNFKRIIFRSFFS